MISNSLITKKLLLIYAIQSIGGGLSFYVVLFLKNNTLLAPVLISALISASAIGNMIGSSIGGYISDKHNPVYGLKIGLGIQGIGLFLLVFSTQFICMLVIMILMGLGSYLYITTSNYVLTSKFNTSESSRVKIISHQNIISNSGMFLSAILMGYCASGYYRPIFIVIAISLFGLAIFFKPFDREYYSITTEETFNKPSLKKNASYYVTGLVAIVFIGMIYAQLKIGYPVYLESKFGAINTGYLLSINPLLILLFQPILINKSSKWNELVALALGLLLLGVSFFVLTIADDQGTICLSCALMTVGEILSFTYAQSLSFGYAPSHSKGRALGLYKALFSLTKIVGVYVAGAFIQYKSYQILWHFCGYMGLVGCFIAIVALCINRNRNSLRQINNDSYKA